MKYTPAVAAPAIDAAAPAAADPNVSKEVLDTWAGSNFGVLR